MADLTLFGFKHSVYTWIVRLALREMGIGADYFETNPFAETLDPVLAKVTPFRRVPVLQIGDKYLTETAAILRYLDALGAMQSLQPSDPLRVARMAQVIGLVDADVYPIMIRQVFSHAYYMPVVAGMEGDADEVTKGFHRAAPVLSVLEQIAAEGFQLNTEAVSLADLHLAPMMSYFVRVPEGQACLAGYPALQAWWSWMKQRGSLIDTDPLSEY